MSKVMGIFVKFYHDHSPNMVMSLNPGCKFRNIFYFWTNSALNYRRSYQIWGNWLKNKKLQAKSKAWGGKHPPPPVFMGLTLFKPGFFGFL